MRNAFEYRDEESELILSGLSYAVTGDDNILDAYVIEQKIKDLKQDMEDMITMSIGGADIKISTASVLSLGFFGGVIGYMAGLVFAVIFQTIYRKIKKQSCRNGFPLLPFLSAGLMLGYVI